MPATPWSSDEKSRFGRLAEAVVREIETSGERGRLPAGFLRRHRSGPADEPLGRGDGGRPRRHRRPRPAQIDQGRALRRPQAEPRLAAVERRVDIPPDRLRQADDRARGRVVPGQILAVPRRREVRGGLEERALAAAPAMRKSPLRPERAGPGPGRGQG
ncbi:MAG: hypothetical protein MZV64_12695 [Ignavibacteriales bacterium]|nr:hypothetical protein [Ignavibacteriales bacterium]